jgi:hypothetical protein
MDKYEQAAVEWNEHHPMMEVPEGYLSCAFRWYDEQRERETCEYRQFLDGNALCNRIVEKQARERMAHICTTEDIDESCGQDIIEKEGK